MRGSTRITLWNQTPNCHWCNRKTSLNKEENPNLMATIDHLRSKRHPNRLDPNFANEKRRVLSCYECNQIRAGIENGNLSWLLTLVAVGLKIHSREQLKRLHDSCYIGG